MRIAEQTTMDQIKHALFIQPHPDDNEIGAGGTIALLRKHGVKVYGLTITKGEGGSSDIHLTPEDITHMRAKEAQLAMERLDMVNLGNLGYDELTTLNHEQLVKQLVQILRELQVDAVFTVDPELKNEFHPTHLQVGKAVCEAFMRCGVVHFPLDESAHEHAYTPKLLGLYFTNSATVISNIDEVMDTKLYAMQAHESQMTPQLIASVYQMGETNAMGYEFKYGEPLRILNSVLMHSFAVPKAILTMEPITIYQ